VGTGFNAFPAAVAFIFIDGKNSGGYFKKRLFTARGSAGRFPGIAMNAVQCILSKKKRACANAFFRGTQCTFLIVDIQPHSTNPLSGRIGLEKSFNPCPGLWQCLEWKK